MVPLGVELSQEWWDDSVDVLVVGGGGAGLMAALQASATGASVLLVDKQPDVGGGATGMSVGSITAAGTDLQRAAGIEDTLDGHYATLEAMMQVAETNTAVEPYNRELTRLMCEQAPVALARLIDLGVQFSGPHPEHPHDRYRMHTVVPSSQSYIDILRAAGEANGVRIQANTTVVDLQRDESGRVSAAVLRKVRFGSSVGIRVRRGVILAAGDFSANDELAKRYGRTPQISAVEALQPGATGDGILLAQALGAGTVNLHRSGGASFRTALAPYLAPERALFTEGGVLVNREGRRFTNELDQAALATNEQPGRVAFLLFDARLAARIATAEEDSPPSRDGWFKNNKLFISTFPGVAYGYIEDYRTTDYFFEDSTIQGLASQINVPQRALASTAEALHKGAHGRGDEFDRDATGAGLSKPPFYAIGPIRPVNLLSAGGLSVDREMRVLSQEGVPIPGLFSCGANAEAGVFLGGHGHHLAWAFGTGMIAGRNAASAA